MVKRSKRDRGGDAFGTAYDATASFGRIMSYFQLIGGIIFGLIFIIVGIVILRKPPLKGSGQAKVTAVTCTGSNNSQCNATIQFVGADGKQYTTTIQGPYSVGQTVNITYDPTAPSQTATSNTVSNRTVGSIFLVVGILAFIGAIAWFYIVQKYKAAAAITGVADVAGIANNIFGN
jgi:hypothetical protein